MGDTGFESRQIKFYIVDNCQAGSRDRLNGCQVKRPEREFRHFQLSSAEFKNERNCTSAPTVCFSVLYRNNIALSMVKKKAN